jgi:hypothetical protein
METLPAVSNQTAASEPSSTDASHSAIGRSTAIDYNLGSIHKNAVLIVDETVAIEASILLD